MPMNPRLMRPLARRQAAFSPSSITGLALWLDGDDASSFTLNSGAVSEWRDKSGNARHFSQPTAALQPALASNVKNAKGAVAFTDDWLLGDYEYDIGTLFIVWQHPSGTDGDPWPAVFSARPSFADKAPAGSLNFTLGIRDANENTLIVDPQENATYKLNGTEVAQAALAYTAGVAVRTDPDRWQYLSAVFDAPSVGQKPIILGADIYLLNAERTMNDGHIAEVIAYESAISPQDVAAVTDYLVAKWGLA